MLLDVKAKTRFRQEEEPSAERHDSVCSVWWAEGQPVEWMALGKG